MELKKWMCSMCRHALYCQQHFDYECQEVYNYFLSCSKNFKYLEPEIKKELIKILRKEVSKSGD